jgi:hypothetical protein
VRAELERVEADAGDPPPDEASVLACREAMALAAATGKKEVARLPAGQPEVVVDGLPRLLGKFEPDRAASLFLTDRCSIERVAVGSYVIDANCHDITASQFAVDG